MRKRNKIKRTKKPRLCWVLGEIMSEAIKVKTAESKTLRFVWYVVIIGGIIGDGFLLVIYYIKSLSLKLSGIKEHQNR